MTQAYIDFTESQAFAVLRSFLLAQLAPAVAMVRGQVNRVGEPTGGDFIVMTPILRERLSTNADAYTDTVFTGSIAGTTLTVSAVDHGTVYVGAPVTQAPAGPAILAGTHILAQLGGAPGGVGTYQLDQAQTVASGAMLAGVRQSLQPTKLTVQLDLHGDASGDNAQIITTLFRDEVATLFFGASGFPAAPLYTSEPRQAPFENAQDQIEYRWVIDAVIQISPTVSTLQQFAATLSAGIVQVDAVYPP